MAAPTPPISADTTTPVHWDPFGETREGLALWFAACSAWGEYFARVARASGPAALVDAQTRLLADCLDLCGQATGNRLRDAGVASPLLNDA